MGGNRQLRGPHWPYLYLKHTGPTQRLRNVSFPQLYPRGGFKIPGRPSPTPRRAAVPAVHRGAADPVSLQELRQAFPVAELVLGLGGLSVTKVRELAAPRPPPTPRLPHPSRSPSRPASGALRSGRSRHPRNGDGEPPCRSRHRPGVGRERGCTRPDQSASASHASVSGAWTPAREPIGWRGGTRDCAQRPRRPQGGAPGSAEAEVPRRLRLGSLGRARAWKDWRLEQGCTCLLDHWVSHTLSGTATGPRKRRT